MNIEVMKTFCDLVETGSFSKAAEANFISQSDVSQQLAKLEKDFGTQLINRGRGLVQPTEAGRAFYQGAKDIVRRFEQLGGEVRSVADAIRGVLRVGTIYSVGFSLLDPYVRRFLELHPDVDLHVEYTHSNCIYASVLNGQMDLGFVAYPEKHRSIEIIPFVTEQLVVVCPPSHPFAQRQQVRVGELSGMRFVGFEQGVPTRRYIDKLLKQHGVEVDIVLAFDNIELLKRAIEVGSGVSILPLDNVQREARYGDLAYVRIEDSACWTRPISVLRRRGRSPAPAEKALLELLRERPAKR